MVQLWNGNPSIRAIGIGDMGVVCEINKEIQNITRELRAMRERKWEIFKLYFRIKIPQNKMLRSEAAETTDKP